jgi:hypothetical protein
VVAPAVAVVEGPERVQRFSDAPRPESNQRTRFRKFERA